MPLTATHCLSLVAINTPHLPTPLPSTKLTPIPHTSHTTSHTWLRVGSCSAVIGPKWSLGMVTMMRPLAALALPLRCALSVTKA